MRQAENRLAIAVYVLCGWPVILIVGGLIGGALGGFAWGVNIAIYKSKMPLIAKIALNLISGSTAIVLYVVIIETLGLS